MKFINAFVLVLTVLLYLVRQRIVLAGIYPMKRRIVDTMGCSGGDFAFPPALQKKYKCVSDAQVTSNYQSCCRPKYKRDPDIEINDENIGVSPVDDFTFC